VRIDILNVVTGKTTVYSTATTGRVDDLSWSDDGRRLSWQLWQAAEGHTSVLVLTPGAEHDLMKASHDVAIESSDPYFNATSVLGGDGKDVYLLAVVRTSGANHVAVNEVDAATGATVRTVFVVSSASGVIPEEETSATTEFSRWGKELLVVVGNGSVYRVDLATGSSTRLPNRVPSGQGLVLAW
jgi:hypothetical protein